MQPRQAAAATLWNHDADAACLAGWPTVDRHALGCATRRTRWIARHCRAYSHTPHRHPTRPGAHARTRARVRTPPGTCFLSTKTRRLISARWRGAGRQPAQGACHTHSSQQQASAPAGPSHAKVREKHARRSAREVHPPAPECLVPDAATAGQQLCAHACSLRQTACARAAVAHPQSFAQKPGLLPAQQRVRRTRARTRARRGGARLLTLKQACSRANPRAPLAFKDSMIHETCKSHQLSRFAAFFIAARA
jgi:hypothetical protein